MSTFYGHKPRIYAENVSDYTNNGLGFLPDAQSCKVTEKLNGGLELEMQYPISGAGYEHIKINGIIYSPINPYDNWQPFRIYSISRPHSGIVKINAEHKAYELSGYPCLPNDTYIETAGSCTQCLAYLQTEVARTAAAITGTAYTFTTDIDTMATWSIESPTDIWSVMAQVAKWYNGEWKYDGTVCRLCAARGEDRHVKVMYGSNLLSCTQDEVDTSYTHIMPYWTDGTTTVYINGYYMSATHFEPRMQRRVFILDLSSEFDSEPTSQQLIDAATVWANENQPKGIEKSLKVSFVSRGQTIEYAALGDIDHVELGDTINVSDNPLQVNSTLRCISLVYDVLRGVYSSAELGVIKQSLATATMTVNERSEATVWVSTTEPTKGYHSGDYWIKIDSNVSRIALALGRYTGGDWQLLCEYGAGTGKYIDNAHTSVAHCDKDHNTSTRKYDSVMGKNNSLTGITGDGANIAAGKNNTVSTATNSVIIGENANITSQVQDSFINGDGTSNSNGGIKYSVVITRATTQLINQIMDSCVIAYNGYLSGIKNSVIVGQIKGGNNYAAAPMSGCIVVTNDVTINYSNELNGCIISGERNTILGIDKSIVSGIDNNVNGALESIISGCLNTVGAGIGQLVLGEYNDVYANHCAVVGEGNYCRAVDCIMCGMYGTTAGNGTYYFVVGKGANSSNRENAFTIDANGNVNAAGTITPGGADYAEYFEWLDGNPDGEDRRGMLVTLDGDKIVPAHGDDFIGVISANPSVIGNNAEMHWHGKYKTDVFGCTMHDEAGKPIISDDYKKQEYIPRSERPEWGLVGLVGRLVIVDDGSCKVGGYVSARHGKGTSCYKRTNARVLRRIDETHVEVLVR